MRIELSYLASVAVLAACGGGTGIDGTIGGKPVAITQACYGVAVDFGSHADQRAGKGPSRNAAVRLEATGPDGEPIDEISFRIDLDEHRSGSTFAVSSRVAWPPREGLSGRNSYRVDVRGVLSDQSVSGVPEGEAAWAPPYPSVSGTVSGTLSIDSEPNNLSSWVDPKPAQRTLEVELQGSFTARHCPEHDMRSTE